MLHCTRRTVRTLWLSFGLAYLALWFEAHPEDRWHFPFSLLRFNAVPSSSSHANPLHGGLEGSLAATPSMLTIVGSLWALHTITLVTVMTSSRGQPISMAPPHHHHEAHHARQAAHDRKHSHPEIRAAPGLKGFPEDELAESADRKDEAGKVRQRQFAGEQVQQAS